MKRQWALLDYALGAIRRRRGRNLAIVLGLAFVVGLFASVLFLTDAIRREWSLSLDATPELTVQGIVAGRPALVAEDALDFLHGRPGVRAVTPRTWGYVFLPSVPANVTVIGRAADADDHGAADADPHRASGSGKHGAGGGRHGTLASVLAEGRLPGPREAVVGDALRTRLGLRVGDDIVLPAGDDITLLRVVGRFPPHTALHTADVVLTTESDARQILGVPEGFATDIAISLTTPDEAPVVAAEIEADDPRRRILARTLLARTYELTFSGRAGLIAASLLPALAALLLLTWERLTGLGESERREIGILKAIGWETRDVLTARLWESGVVAGSGTVLGLLTAYAYVFLAGAPGLADAMLGWSQLSPPMTLVPAVDLGQLLALGGAVVVPFVAVSIVPAWRAAMMDPDRAMRGLG